MKYNVPPRAVAIALVVAALVSFSSGTHRAQAQSPTWADVSSVFNQKCTACHGANQADEGLRLHTWEAVFEGSDHGEAVIPFDADNSLLVELAEKYALGSHPEEVGSEPLTSAEIARIRSWIDAGAPSDNGTVPFADDEGPRLYVANQQAAMVSVIDVATNQVIRTVNLMDLGFTMHAMPHHIVVEPDGSYWYVSLIMDNVILKFSRDNELVGQIEAVRPGLLALDPVGPYLYAGRSMMAVTPPSSLMRIDRRDMSAMEIDILMPRPHALAVAPDGQFVYVSSLSDNRIVAINTATDDITFTDVEGDMTHVFIGFDITSDGARMVATSEVTSRIFVFDLAHPAHPSLIDTIGVSRAPWHPIIGTDDRTVYAGNNWGNEITVADLVDMRVESALAGRGVAQPHGAARSPDGRYVYISNRNMHMPEGHSKADHVYRPRYDLGDNASVGTVVVYDTHEHAVVRVLEVEEYASGMGAPRGATAPRGVESGAMLPAIEGQVRFRGTPPDPLQLLITKDMEVCGEGFRERREVDVAPGGGLRGVVVFLEEVEGGKDWGPAATPASGSESGLATIDQENCRFQPRVQVVPRGAELDVVNSDPMLHNIHAYELIGRARRSLFNISQPESGTERQELRARSSHQVSLECDSHDFMQGWIFVADNPYAVVVDDDGHFALGDVPPGTYTLRTWHPKLGVLEEEGVVVPGGGAAHVELTYNGE